VKFSVQILLKNSLIFVFSSQVFISALVLFNENLGVYFNAFYLGLFVFFVLLFFLKKIDLFSLVLLCIPLWAMLSSVVHLMISGRFDLGPILKMLFVFLSFFIGIHGAVRYKWRLADFSWIGIIILISSIISLLLGDILGVEVSDPTYKTGLVGLTVHPAITAMLISTAIPYLLAIKNSGRYLAILAYFCVFLTMRRTALFGCFPLIFLANLSLFKSIRFVFLCVFFLVLSPFLFSFFDLFDSYFDRVNALFIGDDDSGSGRYIFWNLILKRIAMEFGLFEYFFGEGVGVIDEFLLLRFGAAIGAHNDVLDLVFTYGILPAFFLVLFYFTVVIHLIKLKASFNNSPVEYLCAWGIVFYLIFTSIVSGGAIDVQASALFFALGITLAVINKRDKVMI